MKGMAKKMYVHPIIPFYCKNKEGVSVKIVSGSMRPVLNIGDLVIITHKKNHVAPGSILLCFGNGIMYVHRYIYRSHGRWHLKGDNARYMDPPIRASHILGVVSRIEKKDGSAQIDYMKFPALVHALYSLLRQKIVYYGHRNIL